MHAKVCGITNSDDALVVAGAGADFIGLILAPSARRVTVDQAARVISALPATVQPVLVFRDAPLEEVLDALARTSRAWVQLHGLEPVAYAKDLLARRPGTHLIKAWEIASDESAADLLTYLQAARAAGVHIDAVILDVPKGGPHSGYDCLGRVSRQCVDRPPEIWCAGGLRPDNVAAALALGRYDGVDVASGVETSPGVKDHAAVRAFITAARDL